MPYLRRQSALRRLRQMPTPAKDRMYHVTRFQDGAETDAFVRALQRFLDRPRGEAFARHAKDTEVWAPRPLSERPLEVYLSDGALLATEAGFAPLPRIEPIRGVELPPSCVLLMQGSRLQAE